MVSRLAAEIDDRLAGGRVRSLSADKAHLRLACHRRGSDLVLEASLDPQAPAVAVVPSRDGRDENGPLDWAGGVAPLMRGSTIEAVRAVPNDRIIHVDLRSRSAFGVPSRHRLVLELEPLKVNALVLRPDGDRHHILAAARSVEGREGARDVMVGRIYVPPPPRRETLDELRFIEDAERLEAIDVRGAARLLAAFDVRCTQPLAREAAERVAAREGIVAGERGRALLDAWRALLDAVAAASADRASPVYAWMRAGPGSMCHLVRLTWPPGTPRVVASCNECCVEEMADAGRNRLLPRLNALRRKLATLLRRCDAEAAKLGQARAAASEADRLRIAGDMIYAYLPEIPARADHFVAPDGVRIDLDPLLTAKENAAAYFRRFKKARSGLPRVTARLAVLAASRERWDQLLWDLDRAEASPTDAFGEICGDVEEALGEGPRGRAARRARGAAPPRTVALGDGATAYVGRSSKDNDRVTFSVGGPDDWWFHARGVPGAHVIVKSTGRESPTDEQIVAAAQIAAGESRAAESTKADVDYTQRKHVQKRAGQRAGLVTYTDFRTVRVAPKPLPRDDQM